MLVVFHRYEFSFSLIKPIEISWNIQQPIANTNYVFCREQIQRYPNDLQIALCSLAVEMVKKLLNFQFLGCHSWLLVVTSQLLAGSITLEHV